MRPPNSLLWIAVWMFLLAGCGEKTHTIPDGGPDNNEGNVPQRFSKSFSSNEDFEQGMLTGLNHDAQDDQLQMNLGRTVFETPFIWIPNSVDNTVTQIETATGTVVATIPIVKDGAKCLDPSRTTVNADFDVWVACRMSRNVAKISHATKEVMMIVELEGVPRGLAIDAEGNLWVGCGDCDPKPTLDNKCSSGGGFETNDLDPVYKLNESTGECLMGNRPGCKKPPLMVADWPYGAAVDQHGFLWMLSNHHWTDGTLNKIDTKTDTIVGTFKRTPIPDSPKPNDKDACSIFYGLAIDQMGDVWTGNDHCNDVLKFNGKTGAFIGGYMSGGEVTRGVAVDLDGNVWVANSGTSTASKLSGRTGEILKTMNVGQHPIGVGVDAFGHVWVVNYKDDNVYKINGITFDFQTIAVGQGPYTYSDMLGTALRTITLRNNDQANWTVNFDTKIEHPQWKEISWTEEEPAGSSISVRTRCAADEAGLFSATWGAFMEKPGPLSCFPGRWIQILAKFHAPDLTTSPILKDLNVIWEE